MEYMVFFCLFYIYALYIAKALNHCIGLLASGLEVGLHPGGTFAAHQALRVGSFTSKMHQIRK